MAYLCADTNIEVKIMYTEIAITQLNDFIFCPASIYFHMLYGNTNKFLFQSEKQINGTASHSAIDEGRYSSRKNVLTSLDVYSEKYGLTGRVDIYDQKEGTLIERKRKIKTIYDGYVFQVYAQCVALREMGYKVNTIYLYSMSDNKKYPVSLPEYNPEMFYKFERIIEEMREFTMDGFIQTNALKCQNCIYEPACDRGLK